MPRCAARAGVGAPFVPAATLAVDHVGDPGADAVGQLRQPSGEVALDLQLALDPGVQGHVLVHRVRGEQLRRAAGVAGAEGGLQAGRRAANLRLRLVAHQDAADHVPADAGGEQHREEHVRLVSEGLVSRRALFGRGRARGGCGGAPEPCSSWSGRILRGTPEGRDWLATPSSR